MIACAEAVKRLWDYLENDVAEHDRQAVEEHLAFCRRCCGEVDFARELQGILATAAEVEVELPEDVEARLVGTLDELSTPSLRQRQRPGQGRNGGTP